MNNAQNGEKNVNIQTSKNRRVINRNTLEFLGRSSSNCQPDLPELAGRTIARRQSGFFSRVFAEKPSPSCTLTRI